MGGKLVGRCIAGRQIGLRANNATVRPVEFEERAADLVEGTQKVSAGRMVSMTVQYVQMITMVSVVVLTGEVSSVGRNGSHPGHPSS